MSYETLEPDGAKERLDQASETIYLDVRTPEEFGAGHAPGAYNIPYLFRGPSGAEPNGDFVAQVSKHFAPETPMVVGCAAGMRSARACDLLESAGFQALVNMDGGYSGRRDAGGQLVVAGWEERGHPTSTSPVPGRTYQELQ